MPSECEKDPQKGIDVNTADAVLNVAATLRGVSDALAYRAAAEGDDMLVLLANVLDEQAEALRALVH